jgi:hypothetical protein
MPGIVEIKAGRSSLARRKRNALLNDTGAPAFTAILGAACHLAPKCKPNPANEYSSERSQG